jgi:hypothetical protein
MVPDCDWPDPRSTSAVRDTERLVEIQVTHVSAKEAGLGDTDQRIQVCAVYVDLPTVVVNDLANLADCGFKNAVRRGIRDHKCCKPIASLLALQSQVG